MIIKKKLLTPFFFKKGTNDTLIKSFETDLKSKSYIKSLTFVHKDSAASKHIQDLRTPQKCY
jgi:hypothetical protein